MSQTHDTAPYHSRGTSLPKQELVTGDLEPHELEARRKQRSAAAPASTADGLSEVIGGKTSDELTGHVYDGIEEYDNPAPGWWSWLFLASIVFSALYLFVAFLAGPDLGTQAFYERSKAAETARLIGSVELSVDVASMDKVMADEALLGYGRGVFASNCASCHGQNAGGGMAAPNLTDDHYINVTQKADFLDVVLKGRRNGAMPGWAGKLSDTDLIAVTGYVASLKGTHVGGGKGPEGQKADDF